MTVLDPEAAAPALRAAPTPTELLRVVAWPDPVVDALGHDPRSWYVEHFWLPVLGPTTTWLVRRVAAGLDASEGGFSMGREETARALGLGGRDGRHSPFARAVTRCVTFEVGRWQGPGTLAVRRHLPPLPRRHLLRLPPRLQRMHEAWAATERRVPAFEQQRRRARRLALGLVGLGDGPDAEAMEIQLLRWGVHPSLAHDAVRWAARLPEPEATP